jgi:hypothetical protein
MHLKHDEEEFILLLAKKFETSSDFVDKKKICEELGITEKRYGTIAGIFYPHNDDWFIMSRDGGFLPLGPIVQVARDIEERRAQAAKPVDLVSRIEKWARSNKITAAIIIGFAILAALIVLLSDILNIISFFRGTDK